MSERAVTPTQRRERKEDFIKDTQRERHDLESAINEVASTPAGQRFLQHLAAHCGFGTSKVVMRRAPSGEIIPMEGATLYNCARESVYLDEVREYLTPENRLNIERSL